MESHNLITTHRSQHRRPDGYKGDPWATPEIGRSMPCPFQKYLLCQAYNALNVRVTALCVISPPLSPPSPQTDAHNFPCVPLGDEHFCLTKFIPAKQGSCHVTHRWPYQACHLSHRRRVPPPWAENSPPCLNTAHPTLLSPSLLMWKQWPTEWRSREAALPYTTHLVDISPAWGSLTSSVANTAFRNFPVKRKTRIQTLITLDGTEFWLKSYFFLTLSFISF